MGANVLSGGTTSVTGTPGGTGVTGAGNRTAVEGGNRKTVVVLSGGQSRVVKPS